MSARNRQIVLFSLVLMHALADEAAVYFAYGFRADDIRQMVPDGLLFADASLLGVWVAMGIAAFHIRLCCAAIGTLFVSHLYMVLRFDAHKHWLSPEFVLYSDRFSFRLGVEHFAIYWSRFDSTLLMVSITALVAALLLLQRRFELRPNGVGHPPRNIVPFQFSLRTLLLFALALGPVFWMVRASHSDLGDLSPIIRLILLLFDVSLGFAAATGAVLWAVLGTGNPLRRCFIAILAVGASALLLAYCLGRGTPFMPRSFAILATSHATCVALSLLVVRWCGYQLHLKPGI